MNQTAKPLGPPFPLSTFTRLANPIRHRLIPIDAERVMRLAERITGLHDYGGRGGMQARLEDTLEYVLRTNWNALGRFGLRYILHWQLSNRLRLVELLRRRPDLEDVPVERPIIITGLFRTGTTYLHNLLAADPDNRAGRTWELAYPVGRVRDLLGDARWRHRRGSHVVAMDDFIIPEQAAAHQVTVDAWEEDFFLLENDMAIMKLFVGFGAYDYGMRMLDWDMVEPYQWHKRQLQVLWAQRSAKRWLLKCPWHLWNLEALLTVYPDARVIQTHRDPVETIGSQCSLSARMASKFQCDLDLRGVGRFWLDYSRIGVERGASARARFPDAQIVDVHLDDLQARPLELISSIYSRWGLPLGADLEQRLRATIRKEPTAQLGEHDYDIADYGLTRADILGTPGLSS